MVLTRVSEDVYTYIMAGGNGAKGRESLPVLPCACANLRRAARVVTRFYNQQLRPDGMEITQFTILMALDTASEISQGRLGEILELDSTTLTRMLELLTKRGWVRAKEGADRRVKILCLTRAGRNKLRQASRSWERAQEHLQRALGQAKIDQLDRLLSEVILAPAVR